ncbi:MAG TPA: quinone-dependent dihydroorotate dehydrogenase [Pyrinomonadaceae bacterium]|jgi:dihydroorotate dehydrogenase|nr:quinone-dependent dihydroorotate dehydrogenase [Pyrinomonadaceae bacterium]
MSLIWDKLLRPTAFAFDAEKAHELGLKALEAGLAAPFYADEPDEILSCERFGLRFSSPLGIAAGFDKNGVVVDPLDRLGFGFVEVGTVTARPQPGNPKPRLFRLSEDQALINRLGFNNDGAVAVAERLASLKRRCVIGVNIGRNKDVPNDRAIENYVESFDGIHAVADYIAVNVSSPNTPGLRDLQGPKSLDELLGALQQRNSGSKPLLVKISPDLDAVGIESAVEIAVKHGIAGIIATNTTTSRDGLMADTARFGDGGLSGRPLAARSTAVIRRIYEVTRGNLPIVGVGGIFTAGDAFEKIAAGASFVQAYTGFIYGGPGFPSLINGGLAKILRENGFTSLNEAVGCGFK